VGAETLVGICVKRSLEMVVGLIGVLKAGGAYVPLDPSYPAERRTAMIEDSSPRLLLTEKSLPPHLPAQTPELIMADVWQEFERVENEDLRQVSESENAAYVIYTSGSTGKPKGVVVSHRAVFNQLAWAENAYQLTADDRVIHKTSISFDPSILEIFLPLGVGARVVITEPDGERDPEYLLNVIAQEQITYLDVAPSLLRAILSCPAIKSCSSLRLVVSGSETLDTDLAENFEKTLKAKLCNAYGPTETTVQSTFAVCRPRVERIEPIGRPIANTQVYVLDEAMSPVPVGVAGELYIGGEGLARGYLNQRAITGDRFVPNPYSKKSGERMYRTGDRVKYDGEGNLVFLGRRDEQVKVRGYRVELGEIEAVLNESFGVRQSAVVAIEDGNGMRRLAGFVVGDGEASPAELKRYVRERLPDYMAPEAIVWLESLPLTPSGKVDRKALQLLKVESSRTGQKSRSAQTPFEEIVAGIIEEVLQLERVGREENFFELGGHSLLATQVITRIRVAFGVEIGVRSLFEEPTVEGLSRKVEEVMTGVWQEAPPLAKAKREGRGDVRLPLSFAQERLWILDRFAPNKSFYNIPCAVRLEGKLDLELLERVINEVVRRHEALRTRIEAVEGAPVQVIGEWKRRKLKRIDLTNLTREEREEEARRIARKEARRGFDLNKGPLLRVKALKLGEEQHVLLYTMHHIVSDEESVGKLMQEVGALYDTMSKGQVSPLPELKIQYADYASWQRQHMTGALLEKHLSYWKKQLGGKLPVLDLPVDHPRRPGSSYLGGEKSFSLPAELSQSLRELSRRERVTLSMVLLATFKTLLYRYTSQDDIIVETEAPNRNRAEIEPLIGLFMNMLPLRTDLSGNPRFRELLRRVKEVALGGHIYQDIPFEKLVEEMRPESAARGIPLFNIAFGTRLPRREDLMLNGAKIKPMAAEQEMVRFDVALWVTAGAEGIQVCWTYNKNLFEEVTVMRMHNHFETLLFNIADGPDARLLSLKISSRAETRTGHEEQEDLEGSNLRKLKSIKRKGVRLPTEPA